ncbi:hypothetical protein [Stackebrandtia nassauensis]|uniref:hypothetical protein n=1 Tax=Stackebrandtia nassauensis TaxID=283811 RepID=UPI001186F0FD|nr:hypothetical protein [Stackebrandtia nassauensis]
MYANNNHTDTSTKDTGRRLIREEPPIWPSPTNSTPSRSDTDTPESPSSPIVVMLGLFTACGCQISATMLSGETHVFLDVISRGGSRTSPLATVSGIDKPDPRVAIEQSHRHWAETPEVRWLLIREAAWLYRAWLADQRRPSRSGPHARPRPASSTTPRSSANGAGEFPRVG